MSRFIPSYRPSRTVCILAATLTSLTSLYIYDRRVSSSLRQDFHLALQPLSQEPVVPPTAKLRSFRIFSARYPDSDCESPELQFRQWVKPALVAAGVDYSFVRGEHYGDLARKFARELRGGGSGEGGETVVVLGRHTLREYLLGMRLAGCAEVGLPVDQVDLSKLPMDGTTEPVTVEVPDWSGKFPSAEEMLRTSSADAISTAPVHLHSYNNPIGFKHLFTHAVAFFNHRSQTQEAIGSAKTLILGQPKETPQSELQEWDIQSEDYIPRKSFNAFPQRLQKEREEFYAKLPDKIAAVQRGEGKDSQGRPVLSLQALEELRIKKETKYWNESLGWILINSPIVAPSSLKVLQLDNTETFNR